MTEPEFVTLQVEDGVGTIRLDRPKMNAIDEQLHREVRAAAMEAMAHAATLPLAEDVEPGRPHCLRCEVLP